MSKVYKRVMALMIGLAVATVWVTSCAPAGEDTTTPETTIPAIVGTWFNISGNSLDMTNEVRFNADASFLDLRYESGSTDIETNTGTYIFENDELAIIDDTGTNTRIAFMDNGFLYKNENYFGNDFIYKRMSGTGWNAVYTAYYSWSWAEGPDVILVSNYLELTSTDTEITITGSTNIICTNGTAYYLEIMMGPPPVGTAFTWTDTSSDDWHELYISDTTYMVKVGDFLMMSSYTDPALQVLKYVKQ